MAKSKRKRRLAPGFTESLSSPLKSTSDSSGGKGSGVGRGAGTRTCSDRSRSNSIFCDDENSWWMWSEFSSVSPSCSISARGTCITMWLPRRAMKHWAARKSANRDANNRRSDLTSCFVCGEFCLALLLLWRANIATYGRTRSSARTCTPRFTTRKESIGLSVAFAVAWVGYVQQEVMVSSHGFVRPPARDDE